MPPAATSPPAASQPMSPTVLLVEDDEMLRRTTALVLQRQGFTTLVAQDGVAALEVLDAADRRPEVAVVDVMMPRMDGLTLTRRLRTRPDTADLPIVMLTARDLTGDQLAGFSAGVDDYVVKPFDGEVLAARIRAVLRRGAAVVSATGLTLGELTIDLAGMSVRRGEEEITLSHTEFRLLETLLEHRGAVLSKAQLLDRVWGVGEWADPHVVEVTVQRLRSKIGPELIATVRGVGYKVGG
ncbi:response regulator transcription factor [Ornithinimicrobium sp. Y1847]|uniref:response regulator transcription factor n=1 Tax=Ornithinimicrobium sp. Y1847 TaxID=3405419 RepID=UPI003B674789